MAALLSFMTKQNKMFSKLVYKTMFTTTIIYGLQRYCKIKTIDHRFVLLELQSITFKLTDTLNCTSCIPVFLHGKQLCSVYNNLDRNEDDLEIHIWMHILSFKNSVFNTVGLSPLYRAETSV